MTSEVVNNAATSTNEVGSSERTNNPSDFQGAAPVIQWPSQNIPGTAGGFSGFTPAPNFHRNNAGVVHYELFYIIFSSIKKALIIWSCFISIIWLILW